MSFKFEKLVIWQKAMALGEDINTMSNKFPKKELYNLSSQIRRAVDYIALNIAEGSIGQSNPNLGNSWAIQFGHWQRLSPTCINHTAGITLLKRSSTHFIATPTN